MIQIAAMNVKLHHSHDKLFRETWSNLANAGSFLENYMPKPVIDLVRLDTLEICKDSFEKGLVTAEVQPVVNPVGEQCV